ncbi:MAG: hypothetical protein PUC65_15595 [Clostridiales bacterium]|nr:hypothetical protein [Clostridiales bacterium]
MKQKNSYHMNIGGASILLILAIFALTVFAVLSLRASYHEVKMSEKTRDTIEEYYAADAKAEEILMQISETLKQQEGAIDFSSLSEKLSGIDSLEIDEITHILTYTVSMNYNSTLEIKLKLPINAREGVKVHSWRMLSTEQGDYDDSGVEDIWDGILEE